MLRRAACALNYLPLLAEGDTVQREGLLWCRPPASALQVTARLQMWCNHNARTSSNRAGRYNEIIVSWQEERCVHLPTVFLTANTYWKSVPIKREIHQVSPCVKNCFSQNSHVDYLIIWYVLKKDCDFYRIVAYLIYKTLKNPDKSQFHWSDPIEWIS